MAADDAPPWLAEALLAALSSHHPGASAAQFVDALVRRGPCSGAGVWRYVGGPPALKVRVGDVGEPPRALPAAAGAAGERRWWPLGGDRLLVVRCPGPAAGPAAQGALERAVRAFACHLTAADGNVRAAARHDELQRARAELERSHAALRESERFLHQIVENLPDMVFVKSADDLRFVRFNRAGERLLGFARDELIGKNDYDFFPAEEADFFTEKDREVLQRGELLDIPCEAIQTRERGLRYLHTKKIPILDDAGRPLYLLGISEDITEQKLNREALARTTEQLERSNEELRQFASTVSHDLQEPLRAVRAFAELLAEHTTAALDDEAREWLDYVVHGARRMQHLVRDLLAYARLGNAGLKRAPVALDDVLDGVLADLALRITSSGARVHRQPLPTVTADEVQVGQLLLNLVGNALKFAGQGPPEVWVDAQRDEGGWRLRVRDAGRGFDAAESDGIFEPFRRLGGAGESDAEGTGIGLAVCKRIAERHGGWIRAEGIKGEGATFEVFLPDEPVDLVGQPTPP